MSFVVGLAGCAWISSITNGGDELIIKDHSAYYASDTLSPPGVSEVVPKTNNMGGSLLVEPVAKTQYDPEYPALARRIGIQGVMAIRVLVGIDGLVKRAVVIRDTNGIEANDKEVLEAATLRAAMRWTFDPAIYNGEPIPYPVTLRFKFNLIGKSPEFESPNYDFGKLGFTANDTCALRIGCSVPADQDNTTKSDFDTTGMIPPTVKKQVIPQYPQGAEFMQSEGHVVIKMDVSSKGEVMYAVVMKSTNHGFNRSALYAAVQYEFTPAEHKGEPCSVWVIVPFTFLLRR